MWKGSVKQLPNTFSLMGFDAPRCPTSLEQSLRDQTLFKLDLYLTSKIFIHIFKVGSHSQFGDLKQKLWLIEWSRMKLIILFLTIKMSRIEGLNHLQLQNVMCCWKTLFKDITFFVNTFESKSVWKISELRM